MSGRDNHSPYTHPSLPARPPPSTYSAPPTRTNLGARAHGGSPAAFAGYAPPSVVAQAPLQASAASTMYSQPTVSVPYQATAYPTANTYHTPYQAYGAQAPTAAYPAPPAVNQFRANYDPEEEARIAEWSSAYTKEDPNAKKSGYSNVPTRADTSSAVDADAGANGTGKQKTVVREGGGKKWEDPTLLEWDPLHPRLFVGNLAGEVTDDSLLKAFSKYPSVSKARVVREKHTTKSKSFGFVSFSNTDDYFRAAKEMNGKYIGSHPVLVKRAVTDVRATAKRDDKHKFNKNRNKNNNYNKNKQQGGSSTNAPAIPYISSGVQKKSKNGGTRMLG